MIKTFLSGVFLFILFGAKSQQDQVYEFTEPNAQNVFYGLALDNENILFGRANYNLEGTAVLSLCLKVFNTVDNTLTDYPFLSNDLPVQITKSVLEDMRKAKNGDIVFLFNNFFDQAQQNPKGSFALMHYNAKTGEEKIIVHKSDSARNLLIQKVRILSENDASHYIVAGSERFDLNFGKRYYLAEFKNDSLVYEGFLPDSIGSTLFLDDFYFVNNKFYITQFVDPIGNSQFYVGERDSLGNFIFRRNIPFSLPNTNAFATQTERERGYDNSSFRDVIVINDSTLISPSIYHSVDVFIERPFDRFDTVSAGVYFFTPELDSIKYIELTREFNYESSAYPNLSRAENGALCFGAVMNGGFYSDNFAEAPYSTGLVSKLSSTGDILWKHEIKEDSTDFRITAVVATNDGGCVFAGDRVKEGVTQGPDIVIVKLDSLGTLTSISDESLAHLFDKQRISVYPNPAKSNGQVNLSWSGIDKQNWQLQLYNSQGQWYTVPALPKPKKKCK